MHVNFEERGYPGRPVSGLVAALISRAYNYMYSPPPVQPGHDQVHSWYKIDARMVGWAGVVQVSGQ